MKRKKCGYAILMICLIVFTILLFVKHEQKRLSEKKVLQEEEASEEEAVHAEEETVTSESEEPELTQEEIVEEIISELVCKRLREVDFTIKEYPIDTEVYTEEMDREYKKFFYRSC